MRKILVTSIGSRVGEGVLDSLAERRDRLTVIATNSEPTAAGNFRTDRVYLVLAGRDGDLQGLAILQGDPALAGIRFLSPPPAVAAITRDKHRTFAFARAHGLPFSESVVEPANLDRLIAAKGLPLIGKPRAGNASLGVSVVRSRVEALAVLAAGNSMLQEFLAPPPDLDSGLPRPQRSGVCARPSSGGTDSHKDPAAGRALLHRQADRRLASAEGRCAALGKRRTMATGPLMSRAFIWGRLGTDDSGRATRERAAALT